MLKNNVDVPLLTVESVVLDAVQSAKNPTDGRYAVSTVLPPGRY